MRVFYPEPFPNSKKPVSTACAQAKPSLPYVTSSLSSNAIKNIAKSAKNWMNGLKVWRRLKVKIWPLMTVVPGRDILCDLLALALVQ